MSFVDKATLQRLIDYPAKDAMVGRADQEALDLAYRDGETVRECIHRVLENALKRLMK